MERKSVIINFGICMMVAGLITSCTKDPNSPGYEFMPDMYRSSSVEAYVDYNNPDAVSAKLPPAHTIPFSSDAKTAWNNFPYPFTQDFEGYEKSVVLTNPIPYSQEALDQGMDLYMKFCSHCHGETGDGKGQIVLNGAMEGIPDYKGSIKTLPDGKIFHSISYGKGVMGAHASQLSKEERWKLVHAVIKFMDDSYEGNSAPVVADSLAANENATPAEQPN